MVVDHALSRGAPPRSIEEAVMQLFIIVVLLIFTGLFALMSLPVSDEDLRSIDQQKHKPHTN
jgi:hypothetical protein